MVGVRCTRRLDAKAAATSTNPRWTALESLVPAETARKIVNTLLVMLTKMVESGDGGSSSVGFTSEGRQVRPRVLST